MRARPAARSLILALGAALVLAPAVAAPAAATFPGVNGPIVYERDGQVWTMQPDGSGQARVGELWGYTPVPSPDGTRIAYSADGNLLVADAAGTASQVLWGGNWAWDPAWSPDGSRVVFASCLADFCNDGYLTLANADGSGASTLHVSWFLSGATWSPDGSKIAFADNGSIYTIHPDGTGLTLVFVGIGPAGARLSWSPDGSRIAYGLRSGTGVWVVNADGTGNHRLGDGSQPSWSPDGTRIVYECDYQICAMNADGTGSAQLTNEGVNLDPSWGSAGVRFAFSGFFAPVDNDLLNVAKVGSAIPVKFSLGGDKGLDVIAAGYPKAVGEACDSAQPDPIETYAAGGSGLSYDPATGRYTYVWKTKNVVKGCYQLQLKLVDGSMHVANFRFK
jgi:hypothetical protein